MWIFEIWSETPNHPFPPKYQGSNADIVKMFRAHYGEKHLIEDFSDEILVYASDADYEDDSPIAGATVEGRVDE